MKYWLRIWIEPAVALVSWFGTPQERAAAARRYLRLGMRIDSGKGE